MMKTNLDKAYFLIEQISLPCIISHANDLGQWLSDIREELRECVKSCQPSQETYQKYPPTIKKETPKTVLITFDELISKTGMSRYSITKLIKSDNPPPYIKNGYKYLFDYSEFIKWLKRQCKSNHNDSIPKTAFAENDFLINEEPAVSVRNKYTDLVGVRYNARNRHWQAEIRAHYTSYHLGSFAEEDNGFEKAKEVRKKAEQVMSLGFDYFQEWYAIKYPNNKPIDRKERGYIK